MSNFRCRFFFYKWFLLLPAWILLEFRSLMQNQLVTSHYRKIQIYMILAINIIYGNDKLGFWGNQFALHKDCEITSSKKNTEIPKSNFCNTLTKITRNRNRTFGIERICSDNTNPQIYSLTVKIYF